MEKKLTKKENFAKLYELVEKSTAENKAELLGFIDHEVELLDKKSSKVTMTATQKANLGLLDTIRETLGGMTEPVTISDLIKTDALSGYTNQKISALMKKLVDGGEVEKTSVKKVSYFRIKQ